MLYVFENIAWRGLPFRDASDVLFDKYIVDAFASFARTHDPIPDVKFLEARDYQSTLDIMEKTGTMDAGDKKKNMRIRILDLPGEDDMMQNFKDVEQSDWMGLPL